MNGAARSALVNSRLKVFHRRSFMNMQSARLDAVESVQHRKSARDRKVFTPDSK